MSRRAVALPAFLFLLGLATILGAWAFQIYGGFVPCKLCLEQRVPYYVGLPILLVALINAAVGGPAWLTRVALGAAAIVFLYGAYLGGFHAGVEWALWEGPADCGATGAATSSGNLLDDINNIRIVSCSDASWRFPDGWGLSFAGWNAVVSVVIGLGAIIGAARKPA
jgi:disulfide bond formation protein DsbB